MTQPNPLVPGLGPDRLQHSIEAVIQAVFPRIAFLAQWEMRIIGVTPASPSSPPTPPAPSSFAVPATVSCIPISPAIAALLPPEVQIPIRACACGGVSVPTVGTTCLVAFANGDPGKPFISALDPQTMPGVSVVQALRSFAAFPPLTVGTVSSNAAALLLTLEPLG